MKKKSLSIVAALLAGILNAAEIEQVIVRQQWPWSTDVKVEYRLSALTHPVDIVLEAYNGETKLEFSDFPNASPAIFTASPSRWARFLSIR